MLRTTVAEKQPEEPQQSRSAGPAAERDGGSPAIDKLGAAPDLLSSRDVLGLQATAGNAAVAALIARRPEANGVREEAAATVQDGAAEADEDLESIDSQAESSPPADSQEDTPAQVAQDAQTEMEALSSPSAEPDAGDGAGVGGGMAIERRPAPQIPQLDRADPAQVLATAGSLPPSHLLTALGAVGSATASLASRERAQLVAHPPQRPHDPRAAAQGPAASGAVTPAVPAAVAEPVSPAPAGDPEASHLHLRHAELESRIQGEHQAGLRKAAEPLGEDGIYPTGPYQVLRAHVSPDGGKRVVAEESQTDPAVSLVAQQEKGSEIQTSVAQGLAQMEAQKRAHSERTAGEQARADQEMQQLEETNAAQESAERSAAREQVLAMRSRWTAEQQGIAERSRLESSKAVGMALETVARERAEAKRQADEHLQQGQREAEAARRRGEQQAAEEHEKASGQSSGGFLGWAASAAHSLVDRVKAAVQSVLDKARALVTAAIQRARQLAAGVLERARQVIVGVIRTETDALGAVGSRMSSGFQALSDRFHKAIQERIAAAEATVNQLAGFLRQNVQRVLNGLAALQMASVQLLETGLHAAIDGVRTVVQGALELARNGIEALGTFAELVKDVAANPVQWVSNLSASAMDGIQNHLWPELKEGVQGWFNDRVEAVLGLGAAVWSLLRRGGITVAQVARAAWEGIKSLIPPTIISVLIERVVSLLVPAAAAALLIVQAIQAAWASLGRIVQAFDAFIKYLKAVKWGDAGRLFGQALAAGAVALIDFLSNFLLQRLMGAAGKVAGPLRALAKRIGLRLSGAARGVGAGVGRAAGWVKGAVGGAREWAGVEAAELGAAARRVGRSFRQSRVGHALLTPYDALRGAQVGKKLRARGGTAPVHMTVREFAKNEAAQRQLFEAAQKVRDSQEAFAKGLLADLKIQGEAESMMKRRDFEGFTCGILEKCARKGYTHLGEMDDIVRGRFNLPKMSDVEAVAEALETQTKSLVISTIGPRLEAGVPGGYPRYHVIVMDTETGITHEWQVGTTAVTRAFQAEGIVIPQALKPLPKGMHADLHDIQYDILNSIERDYPRVGARYGLPAFRARVAVLAAEAGKRGDELLAPTAELPERLSALHAEAADILRRLVDEKGPDFIRQFYH